jgi:hypothetical protein
MMTYPESDEETYFESAEGVVITKERAIQEIHQHGMQAESDIAEFLADCGDRETYQATSVLKWLGY